MAATNRVSRNDLLFFFFVLLAFFLMVKPLTGLTSGLTPFSRATVGYQGAVPLASRKGGPQGKRRKSARSNLGRRARSTETTSGE